MRIAICDDEKQTAELFCEKVREFEPESEISIFTNGTDLIQSGELWDIIFLDIEMKPMDGFQVAEILNKEHMKCIYSFITSHAELAIDGYDYQPFRYILKSAPEPVIERKISETIQEYYCRNKALKISYKGTYRTVMVRDIQWIEIKGHCMKIMIGNDEVLWNKTLNEMEKEFEKYGLVRCHRSFVVSLSYIKECTLKGIQLKNGNVIPIGRMYRQHIVEMYRRFMLAN